MDPHELLQLVSDRLRTLARRALDEAVQQLPQLDDDPSAADTILAGRLLSVHDRLPAGNSLVELLREMAGDLDAGSPVRLHGWRRAPGAPLGLALVLTDPADPAAGRAVLGMTPGDPTFDVVVTPGASLSMPPRTTGPWTAQIAIAAPQGWDAAFGPGLDPIVPSGTASVRVERAGRLSAGMNEGPGMSVNGIALTVTATPGQPPHVDVELRELTVAVLPKALATLLGAGGASPMAGAPVSITIRADRAAGVRFTGTGTLGIPLPLRLNVPGIRTRGAALELTSEDGEPRFAFSLSAAADLPGLPLHVSLDGAGIKLPVVLSSEKPLGIDPKGLGEVFPEGVGTELRLPPVSGGGVVRRTEDEGYAGLISLDLGVMRMQAIALFRPPVAGDPTSFLVLLSATFPAPGLQLGLGFALDAVGGLIGVDRSVEVGELQRLISDGNADRVLFPDNAVERAREIIGSLGAAFPVTRGRMLVGPMVRITWGARIVSLSGALILELPAPVRAVLVGRLLVCLPDPVVPLIRLQASVFGRIDPSVPVVELLVSLSGSWIVGLAVRGEMYLLVRGGREPVFVLSAGGFHPRYTRPAGVPALRSLQVDLAPSIVFGLRMEAYLAVTSNAVMFGGQVQLDATIADCGVQGWLGLDALFVFDPVFAFSVRVRAGVAVRAFGRRLASVGLDFTLEGPAPWHVFGTGSISVLFWDVELDFDIRWGSPPAVSQRGGRDPGEPLLKVMREARAWVAERPQMERTGLTFTAVAIKKLGNGEIVHPDATLRVSQAVVPLGVPISRFERRQVPVQIWTIVNVTLGTAQSPEAFTSLAERFVPGEYFDLTEDQQLTGPAFVDHAGGVRVGTDGVLVGDGHRVDDGYETAYEPPLATREFSGWAGRFHGEAVYAVSAAERLERWRSPEAAVRVRPSTLGVAATNDLRPMLENVSLVNATANAWLALRERLDPNVTVQVVESWELAT
ncbi:DUF6603 domain-containing protein [Mesorhizobium sp. L-8-3]|uniref:DUF6603 domain-containing protein n=1 Tax=Mesorhizobium sp. L-8-3 TaxID=2744522 RepID=UPI00192974A4|nr:DUF6603 domain-containing protein [Mesorhizobium sp. L-8-3]BCH23323.1 hypothetical protein MesoLjLb_31080 [Mesorhizobium sp. L-8-3]